MKTCNFCSFKAEEKYKFCPRCGAAFDGTEKHEWDIPATEWDTVKKIPKGVRILGIVMASLALTLVIFVIIITVWSKNKTTKTAALFDNYERSAYSATLTEDGPLSV